MDKKSVIKILVGAALSLCLIFLPIIKVGGVDINLIDCISKNGFDWVSVPFLLEIVLFIFIVCNFIFSEKIKFYYPSLFGSILSVIFAFLVPYFYAMKCGLESIYDLSFIFTFYFPFMIAVMIACFIFYISKVFNDLNFTIRDITEIGIYVALALVLDIGPKFKIAATGGSISAAMLPLIVLVIRKGFSKGFVACGFIYGFINCLIDGYGLFTYPFDYLFGFGSLAVVGLFKNLIDKNKGVVKYLILGSSILLAGILRIISSTISGMIFYNTNFVGSLVYQLTYIPASIGICMVLVLAFYPFIEKINNRYK